MDGYLIHRVSKIMHRKRSLVGQRSNGSVFPMNLFIKQKLDKDDKGTRTSLSTRL